MPEDAKRVIPPTPKRRFTAVSFVDFKEPKVEGQDDEPEPVFDPVVAAQRKERHQSAISFFVSNWNLQTIQSLSAIVDPDDTHGEHTMFWLDLNTFLYIGMMVLVILKLNMGAYLLFFLSESFISKDALAFLSAYSLDIFTIWMLSVLPVLMAATFIVMLAYHQPLKWTKRIFKLVMLFRYVFSFLILTYMLLSLMYWSWAITKVEDYIANRIQTTFDTYVLGSGPEALAAKTMWEFTQISFECCGVRSHRDFLFTNFTEFGVVTCANPNCSKVLAVPVLVTAYPHICCDRTRFKYCISAPREDQVWAYGCLEKAVNWIQVVLSMMICVAFINFVLGVVTTVIFALIDNRAFHKVRSNRVDVEDRLSISLLSIMTDDHEGHDDHVSKFPDGREPSGKTVKA